MYKNQLQELAQRSCFNLPAYSCIREGPDHAPRFKATVNFNGEIFESPHFCTTLRQAEHAAAEVALTTLSRRGPSQSLAAKILDETSVCKNLLQETAQRVGVSLPAYTTIKLGPGHLPVFKCLVEVAGRVFAGEPAKTKKQAEKNAAMAAWSVIKKWTQPLAITSSDDATSNDADRSSSSNALTLYRREDNPSQNQSIHRRYGGRSRLRVVNVRGKNRLSREGSPAGQFHYGASSSPSSPSAEMGFEDERFLFSGQSSGGSNVDNSRILRGYQRSPSLFDGDPSALTQQDAFAKGRANGGNLGRVLPLPWHHQPQLQQQRLSRLSLQSHSDRFELRRPLMEELELLHKEGDDDWLGGALGGVDSMAPHSHQQQHQQQPQTASPSGRRHSGLHGRPMFQSQSERFELKPSLLDELYYNDEEEWWLRGELMQPVAMLERARSTLRGEQENGCIVYHDGNRGPKNSGPESISHVSSDFGNIGSAFNSGYVRDANNLPSGGFHEVASQEVSYGCYGEGSKFPAPFAGFQNASSSNLSYEDVDRGSTYSESKYAGDRGSSYSGTNYDRDKSASSYANFTAVDSPAQYYFSNDGAKGTFLGYTPSVRSRGLPENELGASSSAGWSRSTHLWASSPGGAQIAGLRPANSMAPPVRVRQMVAVCSAPPPRCPALDSAPASNPTHSYLQDQNPPSSSSEASASQLFSQLRIYE